MIMTREISTAARRNYRVNADGWWILQDILATGQVAQDARRSAEEFNPDRASLRGRQIARSSDIDYGILSGDDREYLFDDRDRVDYVIYSYNTPIAWHVADRWVMPDTRYSVTTSKHQGRVRTALAISR